VRALAAVLDRGRMLEDTGLAATGPERAEALGLADLALRRLGQIDAILAALMERTPKPPVRHILRLIAAETVFAGRAAHAAVDLGVRLARAEGAPRMAGLVNAVGRRIAAEGPAMAAAQDAAALDMPAWLRDRLAADWGAETARRIAGAHLAPAPHDLTLAPGTDAAALAEATGGALLPTGSLRLPGRPEIATLPGHAQGGWWLQDAAAALPARLIPEPRGRRVLDLCAAPGGKTLQLAAWGAEVTALDISESRMGRLAENLARTGLRARTVVADALDWAPDAPFDAILIDAPCSATGTIRRHPDLPHRFDPAGLADLAALQARLIDRAWDWLAPGGTLVYAACSLLRAEGEAQARAAFARLPGALPVLWDGPFATPEGWLRTLPDMWADRGGLDGFFAAAIARPG
jgi:16S rRNA (cytosine967-C5)-methyltransferase